MICDWLRMSQKIQVFNSPNYVWSDRDRLGYGATGSVFVGYHKTKGDRVAVKVFNGGPNKSLKREIDVVRSLAHHENIVHLFAVEEERSYRNQVIIMELCTGGSLYEVIDSPENAHGLSESEFKQVIYDVAKGLQHLRNHNFIHRDIKPGNIMRCQKPDGSYVFKLADFGTARELSDEETFVSLHGTEEYLYPGMYERALVNPQKRKDFSAKVDLWSVGATFFHAATGRLPYQPFRKRDDRAAMFKIISEKRTGVICGWQLEPNGPIHYSETLPPDIQLSLGLKLLVTPVLSGLMDNNIEKMMEFNEFFKEIEKINRKKAVDVFCVYSCTLHRVFIDPDDHNCIDKLMLQIQMQTGLPPEYQELFYENLPFQPTPPVKATKIPNTTPERPLFVFGGTAKKTSELDHPNLPTIPSIPHGIAMSDDVGFAKSCAKVIYYFRFVTEKMDRVYRLMHQAAFCFGYTVQHEYALLEQRLASAELLNDATCKVLASQVAGLLNFRDILFVIDQATKGMFTNDISALEQEIAAKQDLQQQVQKLPPIIRSKVERINNDIGTSKDSWDSTYCAGIFHRCIETIQFSVRSVENYYRTFQKDRKYRSLSSHDQKIHEFTKAKLFRILSEAQDKVVSLLTGREDVYTKLGKWFVKMVPLRYDVQEIAKRIDHHFEECNNHLQQLERWESDYNTRRDGVKQRVGEVLERTQQTSGSAPSSIQTEVHIPRDILVRLDQSSMDLKGEIDKHKNIMARLTHNSETLRQMFLARAPT